MGNEQIKVLNEQIEVLNDVNNFDDLSKNLIMQYLGATDEQYYLDKHKKKMAGVFSHLKRWGTYMRAGCVPSLPRTHLLYRAFLV